MRHTTILVALLAFVPLANATAQVPIRPGARVRVSGHSCQPFYSCVGAEHRVGTFVAWKSDTLVVQGNGDTLALPLDSVTRLEVSSGRKTNWRKGMGIGLLVGGVAGAIMGYAEGDDPPGWVSFTAVQKAFIYGFALSGFGGVVGLLGGALIKSERWEEVPLDQLRVSFGPQRDGRFGFGASVSF